MVNYANLKDHSGEMLNKSNWRCFRDMKFNNGRKRNEGKTTESLKNSNGKVLKYQLGMEAEEDSDSGAMQELRGKVCKRRHKILFEF